MLIEKSAKFLRWIYPHALWRMDKNDHSVYLTFDDGPIPESTPFILETLRRFNVKATFFMVGENVLRYHDLYNQIAPLPTATWLDASFGLLVASPQIHHSNVGPCHPRLLEMGYCRRRCTQRKTLYPERLYYYFSRFAQKYRQA